MKLKAMSNFPRLHFFRTFTSSTSSHLTSLERLRFLLTNGRLDEAITLFCTPNYPRTQQTYADLFHACARHGSLSHGRALHSHLLNTHNQNPISSLYLTNHLINFYAKCGMLDYSRHLFDGMRERNIVSWTALVSGYAQCNRNEECFRLFSDMLMDYRPNEFAYTSVLSSCDREGGRQVHALALKTCFDAYTYVANALITMYSQNVDHDVHGNETNEVWMVFRCLKFRNLVTWNSMIEAFRSRGKWVGAINLFSMMRCNADIDFDRATLLSILSSLSIATDDDSDVIDSCLNYCSQVHCLVIKTWFISEIRVITAMTKAYYDLGAEVAVLHKLFFETGDNRDIVSWTVFMTIVAERVPEESLRLFSRLRHDGLSPDHHIFSIVLKACASLVTERHAMAVHCQVIKHGHEDDIVLGNALIHAYGRSGSIIESKKVFGGMQVRDIVSWNTMIKIYGLHGQPRDAFKCFDKMNVAPDATTFIALLSACSHAGMMEDGSRIFDIMFDTYGIAPQLDHYACMVDILGRAGRILDARKFINEMPMEPDSVVWSAMLGACRKHGAKKLAVLAATKLQELNKNNSLGYVLMSNICCSAGNFSDAVDVRKQMKGLGVRKEPGLSWNEMGNTVHEFAAGGIRHPQKEVILANLDKLIKELKGLGYVPETCVALHDIEEEEKNKELLYHSEKLAFVFALMHAEGPFGSGTIRIVKNIRICVDCHNFMKYASKLVQREIIVRDSNRFHHFREGICSCTDYW